MPAMPPARPIALVGMAGSGKTIVGALLARELALPFHDSDAEVVRETGCSIATFFAEKGEAQFRIAERRVIRRLLDLGPSVIATGGGAMARPLTRKILLARAETIWLDAPTATLAARVAGDDARPLLAGADPHAKLAALAAVRLPAYRRAHHKVGADGEPQVVMRAILALLGP